ncbi:MAG: high-affinity nickel-transporter, partial [Chloroflexi bacterium]|nr:high-affinity nickel-transporter [Chloroflexota bacterium]
AAFYGAGHALLPGHGKSMVAAYLVGTRGKVRDAFILGGAATVAHTASIFAIGLLLIWVFYATMDRTQAVIQTWVGIGSGVLVGGIGAFLLPRRFRAWRSRDLAHDHDHHHGHDHGHDHHGHSHDHDHPHTGDSRRMRLASLISLGISGGAVPCPAGLVVIILAFTRKEPVLGIGLLFAFSLGLGLVLVSIGVVLVLGKSTLAARTGIGEDSRWIRALPVISSALIIIVGFAISYQAYLEGVNKGVLG